MRLREAILLEARFSPPIIAFHGSDISNLRSILSQGLSTSRTGYGFGSNIGGSVDKRDMGAVGGIYFSTSIASARRAAQSNPAVIVVAQVQPMSSYADEDDIVLDLERAVNSAYNRLSVGERLGTYTIMKYLSHPFSAKVIDRFLRSLPHSYVELLERQPRGRIIIKEFIIAHLQRIISYEAQGRDEFWRVGDSFVSSITGMSREETENIGRMAEQDIPSPREAEMEYKEELERMTIALKRTAYDKEINPRAMKGGIMGSTFRIDDDITYRGNNRIISVVVLHSDREYDIMYGDLPDSVRKEIEEGYI